MKEDVQQFVNPQASADAHTESLNAILIGMMLILYLSRRCVSKFELSSISPKEASAASAGTTTRRASHQS